MGGEARRGCRFPIQAVSGVIEGYAKVRTSSEELAVLELITKMFDTSDFPARWHGGLWSEVQGWMHVVYYLALSLPGLAIVNNQLAETNQELQRYSRALTGREVRVIELIREVNEFLGQLQREPKYLRRSAD